MKNRKNNVPGFTVIVVFAFLLFAMVGFTLFTLPTSASKEQNTDEKKTPSRLSKSKKVFGVNNFNTTPTSVLTDANLKLQPVNRELTQPHFVDYHLPTNNLILSSVQPTKLELLSAGNKSELISNQNLEMPHSITSVREVNNNFSIGEVFVGMERGVILRIASDSSEIKRIKLANEKASVDGGLIVDETGVFNGDLIAVIGEGRVWRVDSTGNSNLVANLNMPLKGATIIPDNEERYGWLAGKLIVGAVKERGIYAIDSQGQAIFYPLNIKPQDIDIIEPNENLFAISTGKEKLWEIDSQNFVNNVGDILITSANTKEFFSLHFNGKDFQTSTFTIDEEVNQVAFAPISLSSNSAVCVTSISQNQNVFQWTGGQGSFNVNAPNDCNWTVTSNAPWLALTSTPNGTGNGTVTYSIAKNGTYFLREANITVDMFSHRVTQSRKGQLHCALDFNPSNPNIPAIGGNGTINITGSDECAWQAVNDSPWLTLTGNVFGRGNGSVSFTATTNFAGQARQATILFGRETGAVAVTQAPNLAPVVNAGQDQTIALPNTAQLSGSASDDGVGNPVTVSWSKLSGPETVLFSSANNTSGNAIFNKEGVYVLRLTASDGYLTSFDDIQITVNPDPVPPPPDPATTAPPINPTVATNPFDATKFLYTGPNAIQTGVAPGTIKEERVALFRGRVVSKNGQPIPKVKITIQDHPELGQTLSRADGMFDIVVNGGGELNIKYEKVGFQPVQRLEKADWQDYEAVEDVVMIPHDGNVTFIDLNSNAPIQVAESSVNTDTDGTRLTRLFFKQGTTATMRLPNGSTQPLTIMNVRASEFTVGANGPETMPADLPALSAYTYAAAYTVDEAVAVSAKEVTFNQPVIQYNENFLNFPVGINVPSGALDETTGIWMPSANGRVVKILSITSGVANLDLDGSGNPAGDVAYAALGINLAEREQLAALYTINQSLWRVPVIHFSPWDSNWSFGPPPDAQPPGGSPPMCDT